MIVFPQSYNYRLIIGSLVIALVILGSYTYSNYNTLENYKTYITQEKKLLENELSEMIARYESVQVDSKMLNNKLEQSKIKIERILDSIKTLKPSASLLTVYRSKIKLLQEEKAEVLNLVSNLKQENQRLSKKAEYVEKELINTRDLTTTLKVKNQDLVSSNSDLVEKIKSASNLEIEQISAKAVKRITSKRMISTNNSSKANKLFVEFTISKNKLVQDGEKDIYIQILNPNNNVIADQGSVSFGKQSLIYSKKIKVDYKNEDVNINALITTDIDEPLTEGIYFVNIFYDNTRLGSTSITLK
ncbi:hypothetical protein [Olleya sp. YS]|uniref:hypothetical protein n=1 Tax=Olleya sp. YS TaxID=3028318 RepID=UPI002434608F|nr:hypothetical protein [Olleya sp. YS]WGD35577.1 hypothetical protein Ollyesu_04015 [Olleya sp. YS]